MLTRCLGIVVVVLALNACAVDDAVLITPQVNTANSSVGLTFTVDSNGNSYISASFTGTRDFNPGAGVDEKTASSAGLTTTLYITRFNADGSYAWTQTIAATNTALNDFDSIQSMVAINGTLYCAGKATGSLSINGGTSFAAPSFLYSFIVALNAQTGAAVTTFGRDLGGGVRNGIQTFSSTAGLPTIESESALAANATGLYVAGRGTLELILGNAEATLNLASTFAFIAKLSLTTGSLDPNFAGGNLLALFPSSSTTSLALSGSTLFVSGDTGTNPQLTSGPAFTYGSATPASFVLALDSATAAPMTSFDTDGFQVLPQATIKSIAVSNGAPYVVGTFSGTSLGIGSPGTVTGQGGIDVFVAKLTPAGAADTAFGGDGLVVVGSSGNDDGVALTVVNGAVYAALTIQGTATLEGGGKALTHGMSDVALVALDAATGAPKTTFSGDGFFPFGGQNTENEAVLGVKGSSVVLVAQTSGFGATDVAGAFILPVPMATGAVDWTVSSTLNLDLTRETLRRALVKARFGSTIRFDPSVFDLSNSFSATVINVGTLFPLQDGSITIDASDRRVTINGSNAGSNDTGNGFTITSDGNTLNGLSIVGFPGSGIAILGSGGNRPKNNILGGDRTVGTGPNGKGLRITNCGSFGINISGADSNVVKGCWLGLDPSGQAALPNLAGILIQGGSKNNVVGSTVAGEQNVISSNTFEGITVSDSGSDGTMLVGNIIGASAVQGAESRAAVSRAEGDTMINGRLAAANGASGIFLSKGTQANTVGGVNSGEENTIGFNGGAGVEVRTAQSRKNSSKGNRISRNKNGGIKLFDGSNNNIAAPTFDGVTRLPTRFARAVNATVRVNGSTTAVDGSVIEVFRDRGDQGEQIIGRIAAAGGKWQVEADLLPDDNITATVTDPDGNTSTFSVFGRVPETASGTPVITSATAIQGSLQVPLNYRIAATGSPTDYDALNLPAGLSISHTTGVISGTPTVAGTFVVDLAATNANGTGSAQLTLTIGTVAVGAPLIAGPLSASGLKGADFLYAIGLATDAGSVQYGASNLPPGLTIDAATGFISGVPTSAGVFVVLLSASNTFGLSSTTATFSILSGGSSSTDSDGDGVSDVLELLAQTDPLNASSSPQVDATPLVISKTSLGLSFTSPKDKLKTTLTATAPSGTLVSVGILVGGLMESIALDEKGKGASGAFTVSAKRKGATLTLTFSAANVDLEPALSDLGFGDRTTTGKKGETLPLPLSLRLSTDKDVLYQTSANLVYKATAGKTGKATQPK